MRVRPTPGPRNQRCAGDEWESRVSPAARLSLSHHRGPGTVGFVRMSGRSPEVDIFVPIRGEASVRMRYREDNREWLHAAVETRRPKWNRDEKEWLIPNSAAQRVFDQATEAGRSARLTRRFKPDTEKCTVQCQT